MAWCDRCGDEFDPVESTVVRESGPNYCSWDCAEAAYDPD